MGRKIQILDTTLRDGNKLPFVVLSVPDRVALALGLERLGVDVIEAGFPASSRDEAECDERQLVADTEGGVEDLDLSAHGS
jgi:2-isopropylmalate synthase